MRGLEVATSRGFWPLLAIVLLSNAWADSKPDAPHLWVTRRASDPRFIISMARLNKCHLRDMGVLTPDRALRIPQELYPRESARLHEEGTVMLEMLFDDDWCVRKASVLQSSGFFRLDEVSLQYAMQLRFKFDVKERIDGQPVIRLPIGWRVRE
jgi:TonB family protein